MQGLGGDHATQRSILLQGEKPLVRRYRMFCLTFLDELLVLVSPIITYLEESAGGANVNRLCPPQHRRAERAAQVSNGSISDPSRTITWGRRSRFKEKLSSALCKNHEN